MERSEASCGDGVYASDAREYNPAHMRAQRGFSLVEVLAALFVLTVVITTTLGMFVERRKHTRTANETILAYQALSNEVEVWRHFGFSELDSRAATGTFYADTTILQPLRPFTVSTAITNESASIKRVQLTLSWGDPKTPRHASIEVIRTDTGGANLW
jgi:prepilin-type N-terminal cleavage/methylation domain-containing protein